MSQEQKYETLIINQNTSLVCLRVYMNFKNKNIDFLTKCLKP